MDMRRTSMAAMTGGATTAAPVAQATGADKIEDAWRAAMETVYLERELRAK